MHERAARGKRPAGFSVMLFGVMASDKSSRLQSAATQA
jgi:hypothetical protein